MKSEQSIRKVDDTQWKDTIQLQKDEEEFFPGTRVSSMSWSLTASHFISLKSPLLAHTQ